MTFDDTVARLEAGLRRELPGPDAQARLAPVPRRQWPSGFNPARIRHAAGLLLVFPATTINAEHAEFAELAERDDPLRILRTPRALRSSSSGDAESAGPAEKNSSLRVLRAPRFPRSSSAHAHIVLTVRADTLRRHGGQVSLPGGVIEPGETCEQAALREAHEEVALPLDGVRVLGALTPLDIPVSGFRLHPIVAVAHARPTLAAIDGEVARILEVAVEELLDPATCISAGRERDGVALTVPAFHVAGHEIWGATAMVLAEFLTLLGWACPRSV